VEWHRQPGRCGELLLHATVKSRLITALVFSTGAVLTLGAATKLDPIPLGLQAEQVENDERLTGAVCPLREGVYRFAATVAPVTILVDGQQLTGPIHLTPGAHAVLIQYARPGDQTPVALLWARDRESLAPVPAWALRPHKIRSLPRLMARAALDRALALSEWIWVGLLVIAAASLARAGLAPVGRSIERTCAWPALKWILGASLILNVAGLWWGLPGSWVAIELKPQYIFDALSLHFSHGWYDAYPPVHFYVLTTAWSPMLLLTSLGRINFDGAGYTLLVLVSRVVSVAMAAGLVTAVCISGTRAFGRRAGLLTAATVALTVPFLYYAKTANVDVPYLFWWALSMVFYLRLLETGRMTDYLLFAATATLSICTKDQAYGLYVLAPFVIVEQVWRVNRTAGTPRAFLRALVDRRILAAAVVSGVLFALCQNLLFNRAGFMDHVRFITGPGSATYRVYEATLPGRLELLRVTIRLIEVSMGWPLFVAGAIGLLLAAATPSQRRMAVWLLLPAVSSYVTFINVILYNYDRFVLPMCFTLAIFAGLAFDRLLSSRSRVRAWGAAAVAGVFAYTLLYAGTVDVLMIEDSRYDVERWMRAHVRPNDLVGVSGLREYLPRIDTFHVEEIATVAELRQEHPEYVLLNADYARAVPPDTKWGQMIAGLAQNTAGYRLVGRYRTASPWPWLPGGHPDLVGPRLETLVFSTLRNINPTIEVYQRAP
jgi:hypothetical protein